MTDTLSYDEISRLANDAQTEVSVGREIISERDATIAVSQHREGRPMISETITFKFADEMQQKRFRARLDGELALAGMLTNLADGLRVTETELVAAEQQARSQAIDDETIHSLRSRVEWQPIEMAPKDYPILCADKGPFAYVAEWQPSLRCWIGADNRAWEPTHWMPLPSPPLQDVEGESKP